MNASFHPARFAVACGALAAAMVVGPAGGNHYILCPDHCDALEVTVDSPGAVTTDAQGKM